MKKTLVSKLAAGFLSAALVFGSTFAVPASAVDLNSVGGGNTSTSQSSGSNTADYVSEDTFKTLYGDTVISQEEAQAAAELAAPMVKVIRTVMSILLAILPILMLFNCIVDILCLTISPLRKAMMAVQGGGSGGGGGGMGMGMGGMGMGGGSPAGGGQPTGVMQTIAQWASKEAVDAVTESTPQAAGGGGMGMGMGMGGMGGGAPAPKAKLLLVTYFKKKAIFLVVFGVCIIAFSCTAFTDLGLKLGAWIVNKVAGIDL